MPAEAALNYTIRHFLEDEQRLLSTSALGPKTLKSLDRPEGRLLPLPTAPLRQAMTRERAASRCFELRDHERRFRQVVEYIDAHRSELAEAGLVRRDGETLAVREEFVGWLLSCDIEASRPEIPESALRRFLDEWGTRWI